jgi:hypothetical protein
MGHIDTSGWHKAPQDCNVLQSSSSILSVGHMRFITVVGDRDQDLSRLRGIRGQRPGLNVQDNGVVRFTMNRRENHRNLLNLRGLLDDSNSLPLVTADELKLPVYDHLRRVNATEAKQLPVNTLAVAEFA